MLECRETCLKIVTKTSAVTKISCKQAANKSIYVFPFNAVTLRAKDSDEYLESFSNFLPFTKDSFEYLESFSNFIPFTKDSYEYFESFRTFPRNFQ